MKISALFILLLLLAQACRKKDVPGAIEQNTDRVLVEFTDAANGTDITEDFGTDPLSVNLTELRLNPRSVVKKDVAVMIGLRPTVVTQYNLEHGTDIKLADASMFSLPEEKYILTREKRSAMVQGRILPSAMLNGRYAIGLGIFSVTEGEISPVAQEVIVFLSVKNSYDGIYRVKGYSEVPGTAFTGNFSFDCSEGFAAITSGKNSVYLDPAQPVYNNGSFAYISNLLPDIVIDPVTNKVTAVQARPGSLGFIFPFDAGYDSRYDAAAKTLFVKYGIAPTGSGRFIIDTLVYCRPR